MITIQPHDEPDFRRMWVDPKVTMLDMAARFRCDQGTMRRIARSMEMGDKANFNPWTPDFRALIIRRYEAGEQPGAMAREFGLTRNQVTAKLQRMGHIRRRPSMPKPKAAKPSAPRLPPMVDGPVKLHPAGNRVYLVSPDRPLPPDPAEPDNGLARPFYERRFGECSWPVHGTGADMHCCCGAVVARGWCAEHYKRGVQPASARRRIDERLEVIPRRGMAR